MDSICTILSCPNPNTNIFIKASNVLPLIEELATKFKLPTSYFLKEDYKEISTNPVRRNALFRSFVSSVASDWKVRHDPDTFDILSVDYTAQDKVTNNYLFTRILISFAEPGAYFMEDFSFDEIMKISYKDNKVHYQSPEYVFCAKDAVDYLLENYPEHATLKNILDAIHLKEQVENHA